MSAKSVIIATGARYNRLPLARLSEFEGAGVYYAATQMEAQACAGRPVVIVGGGNSAGQAALFLARTCTQVHIVIRGRTLASSMSRYLVDQIERAPQIHVRPTPRSPSWSAPNSWRAWSCSRRAEEQTSTEATGGLFVFIGAKPSTEWLDGQLAQDDRGFLLTGADIPISQRHGIEPLVLETSRPGVFCVGDVRSGSIKRVAAAIGEGSMAVRVVFERVQASRAVADPARTAGLTTGGRATSSGTRASRSRRSASAPGSSTIGKWPPEDLDRLDSQQLACHEPLERRLEELVVGCVDEHRPDIGMPGKRELVGRRDRRAQSLRQRAGGVGVEAGYIASMAARGPTHCALFVLGENGKPSRNGGGASGGAGTVRRRGQRWMSSEPGRPCRHERRVAGAHRVSNHHRWAADALERTHRRLDALLESRLGVAVGQVRRHRFVAAGDAAPRPAGPSRNRRASCRGAGRRWPWRMSIAFRPRREVLSSLPSSSTSASTWDTLPPLRSQIEVSRPSRCSRSAGSKPSSSSSSTPSITSETFSMTAIPFFETSTRCRRRSSGSRRRVA